MQGQIARASLKLSLPYSCLGNTPWEFTKEWFSFSDEQRTIRTPPPALNYSQSTEAGEINLLDSGKGRCTCSSQTREHLRSLRGGRPRIPGLLYLEYSFTTTASQPSPLERRARAAFETSLLHMNPGHIYSFHCPKRLAFEGQTNSTVEIIPCGKQVSDKVQAECWVVQVERMKLHALEVIANTRENETVTIVENDQVFIRSMSPEYILRNGSHCDISLFVDTRGVPNTGFIIVRNSARTRAVLRSILLRLEDAVSAKGCQGGMNQKVMAEMGFRGQNQRKIINGIHFCSESIDHVLQVPNRAYKIPKTEVMKKGWRHYLMNYDCHCLGSQPWLNPDKKGAKGGICAYRRRDVAPLALHYKGQFAKGWKGLWVSEMEEAARCIASSSP